MRPDCTLDVDRETRDIVRMYEAVRQKAEDSYLREQAGPDPGKSKGEGKGKEKESDGAGKDDEGKAKDRNENLFIPANDDERPQPGPKDSQNEEVSPGPKSSGGGPIVNK